MTPFSQRIAILFAVLFPLSCSFAFVFAPTTRTSVPGGRIPTTCQQQRFTFLLNAGGGSDEQQQQQQQQEPSVDISSFSPSKEQQDQEQQQKVEIKDTWQPWLEEFGQLLTISSKVHIQPPKLDERGKGGVTAKESISALDVLLRVPRNLIVADCDISSSPVAAAAASKATKFSWATDLTAAALDALYHHNQSGETTTTTTDDDENSKCLLKAKKSWIENWVDGGWGTDPADLGPPDVRWGSKDMTGTLMATGSDNDHNIYAKFRMPCHPVILRASKGLAMLTDSEEEESREALLCRGINYRAMRDALLTLVETPSSSSKRKGSMRERRSWDVSDMISRILSRVTTIQLDDENDDGETDINYCVVPVHERLGHSTTENTKLVSCDGEILLIAVRDIAVGEELTRDYTSAPQLDDDNSNPNGALRLLLQFGLPPSAWRPN